MLNAGQPGFVNAPVSKSIIGIVVSLTLFGSIIGSQKRLVLHIPDILENFQLWRLITHNFVFSTPGELLFGVVLLYFFRQFERQMGSSKFFALFVITSTIHTTLLSLFLCVFPHAQVASGPYALIFGCLVHFFFETPSIYNFQVFGSISLTDKSFPYFLSLQLLLSSITRSAVPVLCALAAGIFYRLPFIQGNADTPGIFVSFASHFILPLLDTAPRPTVARPARVRRSQGGANGDVAHEAPFPPLHDDLQNNGVSDENIDTLVAMGFSREQAINALERSGDDVQLATERLLNNDSS